MIKLQLNYDGLRALSSADEQRRVLFNSIKAALLMPALAMAILGPTQTAKAAALSGAKMAGPENVTLTVDQVKAFMQSDASAKFFGAKWAVPTDNPLLTQTSGRVVEFFRENIREIDLGYQVLFDEVSGMMGGKEDHFELLGANMGFMWEQIKPGGAIQPRRNINENKLSVPYLEFGDGFSFLDVWFQFNKFYHIEDTLNEYLSSYYEKKAALHYGLITGLGGGINVAFATDAATTFNKAVSGILRKAETKGLPAGANAQVDILVAPENVGRVLAMLDATRGSAMIAFGTSKQPIAFSVRNVIVSTKVTAAENAYYVVLPGRKLKRADWKALTIESKREPSVAAEDWYGRGQYNAIVGDADQVARVAFS